MNSTCVPHVQDVYFQHKALTHIHGQPTYASLKTLLDELEANASSVPTTLGGGVYGHLGLPCLRQDTSLYQLFCSPILTILAILTLPLAPDLKSRLPKTFGKICISSLNSARQLKRLSLPRLSMQSILPILWYSGICTLADMAIPSTCSLNTCLTHMGVLCPNK